VFYIPIVSKFLTAGTYDTFLSFVQKKTLLLKCNFLYQSIDVIQEWDSKQRKIRSLRGFFLYALEIMENGEDSKILSTNLQAFFWRKVKNVIRQNKKAALHEFLLKVLERRFNFCFGYKDLQFSESN